nr:MAG TPA: hypothetical protein [Microviridae sp.]
MNRQYFLMFKAETSFPWSLRSGGTLSTAKPVRCQPCRLARNSISEC